MEDRHMYRRGMLVVALAALLCVVPRVSYAAGTGDDPKAVPDVLTAREAATKAGLEQQTQQWLVRGTRKGAAAPTSADAPYRYLYTPSHEQQRSYYCGPATVQVIVDYFTSPPSQDAIATYLGTTTSGTSFSKVDDALRHYTGRSYYYYDSNTGSSFNARVLDTLLNHSQPFAADVRIDADVWPHYAYDHDGHIIPIEAFDWRSNAIRINDVYDEEGSRSGGGDTFGHTTYSRDVIWAGVYSHPQRALVCAP